MIDPSFWFNKMIGPSFLKLKSFLFGNESNTLMLFAHFGFIFAIPCFGANINIILLSMSTYIDRALKLLTIRKRPEWNVTFTVSTWQGIRLDNWTKVLTVFNHAFKEKECFPFILLWCLVHWRGSALPKVSVVQEPGFSNLPALWPGASCLTFETYFHHL